MGGQSVNPFTQMATVLASQPAFPTATPVRKSRAGGVTRTDSIRDLLRESSRPLSAAEIAYDLDLPSSCTVWLLMKYDMQKGRVLLADGRYTWNHDYDTMEAQELRDAVKLLRRYGYTVNGPV